MDLPRRLRHQRNKSLIENNIKNSFEVFEDKNDDGENDNYAKHLVT